MTGSFSYYSVRNILINYGMDILETEEFREACLQEHHYTTNVGAHSVNVAVISIMMCLALMQLHIKIDMEAVVHAALCHDLGILRRNEKYKNEFQCCMQHPVDSVVTAKRILKQYDDRTLKMIETHMWPARPGRPTSLEGYVISLADKYAAIMECTHRSTVYHCRHIVLSYA